ncbi:MAG: COX15/CtaA family protein [Planctomycetota bacterium]
MTGSVADQHRRALGVAGPRYRRWLHGLALGMVACTFLLLTVGGVVTTLGEGLAVYDGWTSFGYYVPLAPLEYWVHDTGKFVEHSHRLVGKVAGVLAIALAVSLWWTQRGSGGRRWLAWLGIALLLAVILQGAKGAFRIDWADYQLAADGSRVLDVDGYPIRVDNAWSIGLALVHGVFGQLVFAATVLIAAAVGPGWVRWAAERSGGDGEPVRRGGTATGLRWAAGALVVALVGQLVLGAAVRHLEAWNAIPDFPLTWGQVLPPVSQASLDAGAGLGPDYANGARVGEVHLQFTHRVGAVVVTAVAAWLIVMAWRAGVGAGLRWVSVAMGVLLAVQWGLGIGAALIGRGEPAWASLHQVVGATLLGVATLIAARAWRARVAVAAATPAVAVRSKAERTAGYGVGLAEAGRA